MSVEFNIIYADSPWRMQAPAVLLRGGIYINAVTGKAVRPLSKEPMCAKRKMFHEAQINKVKRQWGVT